MGKKRVIHPELIENNAHLRAVKETLDLIEEQIERSTRLAICEIETKKQELENDVTADESDWGIFYQKYDIGEVRFKLSCTLRNPFLVTLFSVYELVVVEIAELIQGKKFYSEDIKGNFLDWSKGYYKDELRFQLMGDNERWKRLKLLSDLRNAIVHRFGRVDMVDEKTMERIRKHRLFKGDFEYIVVSEPFLRETFAVVKEELEELMKRYGEWKTAKNPEKK